MTATLNLGTLANTAQILSVFVFPAVYFLWRLLKREMSPNGGSSMRDAINRLEEAVAEIRRDTKHNRKEMKKVRAELETHLADFEEE